MTCNVPQISSVLKEVHMEAFEFDLEFSLLFNILQNTVSRETCEYSLLGRIARTTRLLFRTKLKGFDWFLMNILRTIF